MQRLESPTGANLCFLLFAKDNAKKYKLKFTENASKVATSKSNTLQTSDLSEEASEESRPSKKEKQNKAKKKASSKASSNKASSSKRKCPPEIESPPEIERSQRRKREPTVKLGIYNNDANHKGYSARVGD
mmetsp:Transcript_8644/g.19405  ORF Transcript_8644/g.19405 Transcript_8644/m.19405 type:complete len:131 (+) Transcript_8644:520-912(+)